MNDLILGYVRITWLMTLFCARVIIKANLRGNSLKRAEDYCNHLLEIGIELDKIAQDTEGAN